MPPEIEIPGFLAQAARMLLGVTQAWLWEKSGVSRKTINDYENGYRKPKSALRSAIRRALEGAGAHFIFGDEAIGVIVYSAGLSGNEAAKNSGDGLTLS
jgi:DNA-binding XRE family transcriptional regulator